VIVKSEKVLFERKKDNERVGGRWREKPKKERVKSPKKKYEMPDD